VREIDFYYIYIVMLSDTLKASTNPAYIFHKMLDAVPISMLLANVKGEIVFANRFTEQLFGYDQQELLGKAIEQLIPERFRKGHPAHRTYYMNMPKIRPMGLGRDLFGLRIDGSEVPVEIGLTPVRIEAGFFVLASIVDISERVYVKSQLASEEIKKKQLEDVNDQLAEFANTVSHDLMDPFLKLETFLPKTYSNDQSKEVVDAINIINASVKKGKELIRDLLNYAQSSSVQMVDVNLNDTVEETVKLYSQDKISFKITNLPQVKADKVLMRQLFSNLISNSAKFRKSDVVIEVGIKDGVFFVKDNGIGIAQENIPKLFTPFYRIHPKDKYMGSGLGLSICKRIVEKHGGKIWIESKLGEWTTVFFILK